MNPNQLRCYGTMVWDNTFNPTMHICLETCEGGTIDIILDGTIIGFSLHVPTKEELRTLPHIEVTSSSEWNLNTVKTW